MWCGEVEFCNSFHFIFQHLSRSGSQGQLFEQGDPDFPRWGTRQSTVQKTSIKVINIALCILPEWPRPEAWPGKRVRKQLHGGRAFFPRGLVELSSKRDMGPLLTLAHHPQDEPEVWCYVIHMYQTSRAVKGRGLGSPIPGCWSGLL